MISRIAALGLCVYVSGCVGASSSSGFGASGLTHGPMLGRQGTHEMGVWGRTSRPGMLRVRYGTRPDRLNETSDSVRKSTSSLPPLLQST